MHITEFNTSYNPFCPIHDTLFNAVKIAGLLSRLGDVAASYSYWTFGDVFEEKGVPPTPFHGGFGLMANGMIPKPTLWTFHFFNNLSGECVHRDGHLVLMKRPDGGYEGVAWNAAEDGEDEVAINLTLPGEGQYAVLERIVDERHGNPLPLWLAMGQPASLSREQRDFLREAARPEHRAGTIRAEKGKIALMVKLGRYQVTHLRLLPVEAAGDYGYDPEMYL